eukprot:IDg10424t1
MISYHELGCLSCLHSFWKIPKRMLPRNLNVRVLSHESGVSWRMTLENEQIKRRFVEFKTLSVQYDEKPAKRRRDSGNETAESCLMKTRPRSVAGVSRSLLLKSTSALCQRA